MFNEIFNRTDLKKNLIEKLISEKFKSLKHCIFDTQQQQHFLTLHVIYSNH